MIEMQGLGTWNSTKITKILHWLVMIKLYVAVLTYGHMSKNAVLRKSVFEILACCHNFAISFLF